jgi:heavy metal sensor kinase
MMRSLRSRLLAGVVGGMILLLTIFSLLLYTTIRGALVGQFDTALASVAQVLAAAVERDGDQIELEFDVQQMPEFQKAGRPTHYQLWGPDGATISKSPLLGGRDLVGPEKAGPSPVFGSSRDEKNRPQRFVGLTFVPRSADNGDDVTPPPTDERALTLAVARDAGDLHGQLRSLRWLLLSASAVVVLLSLLIGQWVVGRGLRPLHAIATEIAAIRVDDLATRVGVQRVPGEAVPICDRLNELLSRLERSLRRERRFNADVAHELRTPLAGIRSTIEVSLTRPRDVAEYREALRDCLEIAQGMQTVVNRLLLLARLEARQIRFQREPVPLADLVQACWRPFQDRARQRGIAFENRTDPEVTWPTDREHLSMVISNLLDNAVEYADHGGRIWTTAGRTADSAQITISNTGCRLTAEQVTRVFDSFWRGDGSRAQTGAHCGLGLALVQRLVRALEGDAVASLQAGGVFTMQLTFAAQS